MTREPIDLPQNVEDLQLMSLQLREELIDTKVARDHLEETLKADALFLKEQVRLMFMHRIINELWKCRIKNFSPIRFYINEFY